MSDFDAAIERLRQTCAIAEANRQIAEEENQQLRKLRDELRILNEDKHRHLEAYRKAASEDKAEIERLRALCDDLVGEESLHQEGKYETEMRKLRQERDEALADREKWVEHYRSNEQERSYLKNDVFPKLKQERDEALAENEVLRNELRVAGDLMGKLHEARKLANEFYLVYVCEAGEWPDPPAWLYLEDTE